MARNPHAEALIQREFPTFDVATLPSDIPDFVACSAWKNDICPSWRTEGDMLELWIDFPNAEDREFPESPRFLVQRRHSKNHSESDMLYQGDDWEAAKAALVEANTIECLAVEFSEIIGYSLAPEEMGQVLERNDAEQADTACCATQDFMDANMAMEEAWNTVMKRPILPDNGEPSEADFRLWNAAWSRAKAMRFFVEKAAETAALVEDLLKPAPVAITEAQTQAIIVEVQRATGESISAEQAAALGSAIRAVLDAKG